MKITTILLFASCLQASAHGYAQKVTISLKNAPLERVFKEVKKQTGYSFIYTLELLEHSSNVTLELKDATLSEVLENTFKGQALTYSIERKFIIIKYKTIPATVVIIDNKVLNPNLKTEVKGTVYDESGQPLSGTTIKIKGTQISAVTDENGKFSLQSESEKGVIIVSFVGFETKEIAFSKDVPLSVALSRKISKEDEIIVVGYGTQKKRDITGSIAFVSTKDIEKVKVTSIDQALQGNAAGVLVTQSSGQPGAAVSVLIRGAGRFGSSEPLYIIDGVIVEGNNDVSFVGQGGGRSSFNPLAGLNPDDIQSMEVLKDAGSAAIYGARAGNGVVIITTKRGQKGKTKITFDAYYGKQNVIKQVPMLNTTQYFQYHKKLYAVDHPYSNPDSVNYDKTPYRNVNTNWQDEIFNSAPMQNYTLNISGGNDFAKYSISGGYFEQEGILIASNLKRYTLRSANEFNISKRIKAGLTLNLSSSSQRNNDNNGNWFSPFQGMLKMVPYLTPYTKDPKFYNGWNGPVNAMKVNSGSPFAALANEYTDQRTRLLSAVYTEIELITGLKYKLNIGLDLRGANNNSWGGSFYTGDYGYNANGNSLIGSSSGVGNGLLFENTLAYSKEINKHSLNAVVGISQQKNNTESYFMSASITNQIQRTFDAASGSPDKVIGGSKQEYLIRSQFGRIDYSYDGKYLLSGTVRRDGSSRFGPENRWGVFPAFSAGWRISKENFMSNVSFINDLKLYGSWGELGNDGIGNYRYSANVIGTSPSNWIGYAFGNGSLNQYQSGLGSYVLPNTALRWETTKSTNVGLSGSLLKNKITFEAEYYVKNTKNLLVDVLPVPQSLGVAGPPSNAASISNKGMDFTLGYMGHKGDFNFSVKGNLSLYLENKVIALGDINPSPILGGNRATAASIAYVTKSDIGGPVGAFWGYKMLGIWQEKDNTAIMNKLGASPGDVKFEYNPLDTTLLQQVIGDPNPKYSFGLTLSADYKGIDFSAFLMGVQGNDIFNYWDRQLRYDDWSNYTTWVLDSWTPDNKSNSVPRVNGVGANNAPSSMFIQDGSYIRIRSIQLGYSLPQNLLSKMKIEKLRLYISGQNLFTFTKYEGFDPEIGGYTGYNVDRGIDTRNYPGNKTILFGVQLGF